LNTEGVIERVQHLFSEHQHLVSGFNQFLPEGYQIEVEETPKPTMEFKHAVQYVSKIKERFSKQPEIYEEFLDILHGVYTKISKKLYIRNCFFLLH